LIAFEKFGTGATKTKWQKQKDLNIYSKHFRVNSLPFRPPALSPFMYPVNAVRKGLPSDNRCLKNIKAWAIVRKGKKDLLHNLPQKSPQAILSFLKI
jgi:hypothetical protein